VHLRQPQAPEGALHRAMGAKGNYRFDAAHHLVRKSRSASKTAPTGWLSELGEITRRGHATNGAMNHHGLFPMLSTVRARRPTPPEPTDRPPRSWRAIHRRTIPLTRRRNNHLAAAGTASVNHDVGGSVSLPRLWFETDGRTDSATASTVPSPTVNIDVRAHMIASSKNILLSTRNGIGRSVNLKGIIVALRVGVLHGSAS